MKPKYKTFKKPENWEAIVQHYKQELNADSVLPELSIAADIVNKLFPEVVNWKDGRIQLIRNLYKNIWIDVKYRD